jgi:hypothetical protein
MQSGIELQDARATETAKEDAATELQQQEARAKETGKEDEHKGQLGASTTTGRRAKGAAGGSGIKVAMLPGCCC